MLAIINEVRPGFCGFCTKFDKEMLKAYLKGLAKEAGDSDSDNEEQNVMSHEPEMKGTNLRKLYDWDYETVE